MINKPDSLAETNQVKIDYKHFFQNLLNAAPWPVLIIDRNLAIIYYNQRAAELFAGAERLDQIPLQQLTLGETISHLVRQCQQTGESSSSEHEKDQLIWKISVNLLEHQAPTKKKSNKAEEMLYFTVAIEDLTELRRLERIRRDFIANVSHELRTPLASVRLLAETLEDAIDTDRDKAQSFVGKIEDEVQYLTSLVTELLDLSRIEAGQVPMNIEPIESAQMIHEILARMLPLAQRHRVQIQTEIKDGSTLVAADSRQITRVLVNLVHNAIKFTPSGGTVTIGTLRQRGGQAQRFYVRDTGIGMRPEDLPRVFERFYKVNRARSKSDFIGLGGGGSGLGLAIARHVVEAHGGRMTAESVYQHGSTFTFTLPVVLNR